MAQELGVRGAAVVCTRVIGVSFTESQVAFFQILGAAYIFGATADHMNEIYDRETEQLEPWHDAPGEIAKHDWREFLGKREWVHPKEHWETALADSQ